MDGHFLKPQEHFEILLNTLEPKERQLYDSLRHTRAEAAFVRRSFVVYEIRDRKAVIIDNLTVLDLMGNHTTGFSTEIRSQLHEQSLIIGYAPIQLWGYPIFMHLPLHGKYRWSSPDGKECSMAFDILIRTKSRFHLEERDVTYCEAGIVFAREFKGRIS